MKISAYILPVLFLILLVYARKRRVNIYDAFTEGAKGAIPLAVSLFPYLAAIFVMTGVFEKSGLSALLNSALAPVWKFLGVPEGVGPLILIKPFSGSGSLAVLSEVYAEYGADSYVSRCASVIFGSSETVFYVSAVYFSSCKNRKLLPALAVSLAASFISALLACLICRIM
ncbi:MAG: spore maturation protein [Clostridia bacterium]|nr:spore maturation protein [Clostridia bacterium]MBQ9481680.1 spore maturation protein [Clostridia bacterium]